MRLIHLVCEKLHWKDADTGSAHNLVSYQSPLSRSNTESLLTPAVPRFTLPIRALGHEVSLRSELPPSISVKKSYETLEPIPSRKDIMMAHDRGLFTPSAKHQSRQPGRTVDWNCLSCGISYTDDVQHCIVYVVWIPCSIVICTHCRAKLVVLGST
jgi:hypothetical protein